MSYTTSTVLPGNMRLTLIFQSLVISKELSDRPVYTLLGLFRILVSLQTVQKRKDASVTTNI